ncbi:MAG: phosphodiester glycosidase family protein [Bacteroidales bacterium]
MIYVILLLFSDFLKLIDTYLTTMKKYYLSIICCFLCIRLVCLAGNINIQGKEYRTDTLSHYKVGPGTVYTALTLTGPKKLQVFFLEVDATNPYISFNSLMGKDSTLTCERISSAAARHSKEGNIYFAGTNADFFVTSGNVGWTINGSVCNGEIGRLPHASNPMIGFDLLNKGFLGRMAFSGMVKQGEKSYSINAVNESRGNNQMILYNSYNGKYTHTNSIGTEVLLELDANESWNVNRAIKVKVLSVNKNRGNARLEPGQAVLSGHGTAQVFLDHINPGDNLELSLNYTLANENNPFGISGAVGGDRAILENGAVLDNDWADSHPRTAVGYSADRKKVFFLVVDGRSDISAGVSTKQLADIIKSAGAHFAINLDGGGSSGMYIKEFGMMNNCSDGYERSVANGLFIVSTAPADNEISEIISEIPTYELPYYGVIRPTIMGYNKYGVLLNKDIKGFKLSCDPELGYINEAGDFVSTGKDEGHLIVSYGSVSCKIRIKPISDVKFSIRLDSVLIDNRTHYPIEITSLINGNEASILPSALNWTIDNPLICKIENGILSGLTNGRTIVRGKLNDITDTLIVNVEIPESGKVFTDNFSDLSGWNYTVSTNLKDFKMISEMPHSAVLSYTYTSGRAPNIRLSKLLSFYGLPDSVRFVADAGNVVLSKVVLAIKNHDQTVSKQYIKDDFVPGSDIEFKLSIDDLADNPQDINIYPLTLDYISFYLSSAGNIPNKKYSIRLKELSSVYKNIELGMFSPQIMSKIHVYPNPVLNGEVQIAFEDTIDEHVSFSLYSLSGTLVRCVTKEPNSSTTRISLKGVEAGTYLLSIQYGSLKESVKLIIR